MIKMQELSCSKRAGRINSIKKDDWAKNFLIATERRAANAELGPEFSGWNRHACRKSLQQVDAESAQQVIEE